MRADPLKSAQGHVIMVPFVIDSFCTQQTSKANISSVECVCVCVGCCEHRTRSYKMTVCALNAYMHASRLNNAIVAFVTFPFDISSHFHNCCFDKMRLRRSALLQMCLPWAWSGRNYRLFRAIALPKECVCVLALIIIFQRTLHLVRHLTRNARIIPIFRSVCAAALPLHSEQLPLPSQFSIQKLNDRRLQRSHFGLSWRNENRVWTSIFETFIAVRKVLNAFKEFSFNPTRNCFSEKVRAPPLLMLSTEEHS